MKKINFKFVFGAVCIMVFGNVFAQDPITQPQGNYGLTSILDGAPPAPGFYLMEYGSYYSGTLKDNNGNDVTTPLGDIKVNSLLLLNQGVWITNKKILGGQFLLDVLVPLVHLGIPNYEDAPDLLGKNTILGDVTLGVGVQWFNKKLFGLPYFHRLELDFILPTGGYDKAFPVNVGSGFFSFQPYYAQTLFFSKSTSLSLRHHLTFNSKVDRTLDPTLPDVELQAGSYYHVNYSLETLIGKRRFKPGESGETRLAVQGYYGTQFGEDQINGVDAANSKEKIFAVGPALHLITKKGLALTFKTAFELGAENRTEGIRSTIRLVKFFPPKPKKKLNKI